MDETINSELFVKFVMIRRASVAGSFYPYNKTKLLEAIELSFNDTEFGPGKLTPNTAPNKERRVLAGVCPHAGYFYSGAAATHTFKAIFEDRCPDVIIVLGTQHTGYRGISLMKEGKWVTPLGDLNIDEPTTKSILTNSKYVKEDNDAFSGFHQREHNIEVQLPFIQYASMQYNRDISFVPIKVGDMNLDHLMQVGEDLAQVIINSEKDIAIIASSDMTHKQPSNYYQPQADLEDMKAKDNAVMESVANYDWKSAYNNAQKTSVCGPQTIVTAMIAAEKLGATEGKVLKYYTSYEKMGGKGPCEYSVGYLSAVFTSGGTT